MPLPVEPQLRVEHVKGLLQKSYDRIAPAYNRPGRPARWQLHVANRLMRVLPPGGRVLDLGCGVGKWMKAFHARGFRVAGIDQSPQMVKYARRRVPQGRFVHRNMINPGFTAGSFDGIVSFYSACHNLSIGLRWEVVAHPATTSMPSSMSTTRSSRTSSGTCTACSCRAGIS